MRRRRRRRRRRQEEEEAVFISVVNTNEDPRNTRHAQHRRRGLWKRRDRRK